MRSNKTFEEEYGRLKTEKNQNFFFTNENEYKETVYEDLERLPHEEALDQCKEYVDQNFPDTEWVEVLRKRIIELSETQSGSEIIEKIDNFIKEFFFKSYDNTSIKNLAGKIYEAKDSDDFFFETFRYGFNIGEQFNKSPESNYNEWAKKLLEWLKKKHTKNTDLNNDKQPVNTEDQYFFDLDEDWNGIDGIQSVNDRKVTSGTDLVEAILETTGIDILKAISIRVKSNNEPNLSTTLSADAFGYYLPYHAFGQSKKNPWGMYIIPEALFKWTDIVFKTEGGTSVQDYVELFNLLYWATYRHELFHYHVESYAFMLEVANRVPHYRPYVEHVRKVVANTSKWLEEALAQSVVLHSTFLQRKTSFSKKEINRILEFEFKKFGPGYRDYECKWTGGPKDAHQRLGTQIACTSDNHNRNEWVTDLFIPKTQYSRERTKCPGYFAFTNRALSQFQLPMPNEKRWKKFAKKNGFIKTNKGPGDHQVWIIGKQKVQINYVKGEVDFASLKAVSKILDIPIRELSLKAARG